MNDKALWIQTRQIVDGALSGPARSWAGSILPFTNKENKVKPTKSLFLIRKTQKYGIDRVSDIVLAFSDKTQADNYAFEKNLEARCVIGTYDATDVWYTVEETTLAPYVFGIFSWVNERKQWLSARVAPELKKQILLFETMQEAEQYLAVVASGIGVKPLTLINSYTIAPYYKER